MCVCWLLVLRLIKGLQNEECAASGDLVISSQRRHRYTRYNGKKGVVTAGPWNAGPMRSAEQEALVTFKQVTIQEEGGYDSAKV